MKIPGVLRQTFSMGSIAFAAIAALPETAAGQPRPMNARAELLDQAGIAREAGDHARAAALLRAAYVLSPALSLRWATAVELFMAHDRHAALTEAAACVTEASASREPDAVTAQSQCNSLLARLQASGSPSDLTTLPGSRQPVTAESIAVPSRPSWVTRQEPTGTTAPSRVGPAVLFALGGATAVTTVILWSLAHSAAALCPLQGDVGHCHNAEDLTTARNAPGYALAGNVIVGVSAAAIAGGALWWILDRGHSAERIAVGISPTGVGMAGRF